MSSIRATTRVAHNGYTHWLTDVHADPLATHAEAEMAGVVDGDVGPGRFVGQLINSDLTTRPGFWLGHARYEFSGQRHSFVADVGRGEEVHRVGPCMAPGGVPAKFERGGHGVERTR
jgi:hypothetical protein